MYARKTKKWNRGHHKFLLQFLLVYFKAHPCVDCGEMDSLVLTFDHVRGRRTEDA